MIRIRDVVFSYPASGFSLHVSDLTVEPGEKLAIIGASGTGKTTLLKLIAGIFPVAGGCIEVDGAAVHQMSEAERRNFRISRIGFVFQELELLDYLTVIDNIVHTYRINRILKLDAAVRSRAKALAEDVGLGEKLTRKPHDLSQGERQRTAVCRALLTTPHLLLADEATGNLDPTNKVRILDLLFRAAEHHAATLISVTHDHELLPRFDRVVDFSRFQP